MLAVSELGSWLSFLIFHLKSHGYGGSFAIGILAIVFYAILNILHAFVFNRSILPKSLHTYKAIHSNFRRLTKLVMWASLWVSFRISLILVSSFCMLAPFKGDYSGHNWL